jgi:predicted nucleic acid-binding protein
MVLADREVLTQALTYLKKYNRDLSFTDCITLATMDKLAAQHIPTFDSDFDNVTLLKTRKRVVNIRWLH